MVYYEDRHFARSWKEIIRMKATTLTYEKQAAGKMGMVKTGLDFSHGSAEATCSKPATKWQKTRLKCRRIGLARLKRPRQSVYTVRMRSGRPRRRYENRAQV